jgi:hypothetical protein
LGRSAAVNVAAVKVKSDLRIYLFDEAWKTRVENTTQLVGTRITIVITLNDEFGRSMDGKSVDIYHSLNGGPWEKIRTVVTYQTSDHGTPAHAGADIIYTLAKAGTHTFYAEFAGDEYYEGCPSTASKLTVPGAPTPTPIPEWLIGLGIVAGACVLTLAVTKALKWW